MAFGTPGVVIDHDIVITSSDGGRLGLMLADTEDNKKAWQMAEIPAPSGVRVTNEGTGVQDQPPEMASTVFRTDSSEGMGPRIAENLKKTYMSGDIMATVSGKVIKPPYAEELTLPSSEGKVRCMAEFNSAFYISDGRYLHRTTNGSTFTQVMDAGSTYRISDLKVFGDTSGTSGILACVETDTTAETAQSYYYSTDGTTFAQVNAAGNRQFNYMFVKDKTLYGLVNPATFYTCTDPFVAAATWAGATVVGDRAHKFQGGFVIAGVLVIFKEDRAFTVDASGVVSTLIGQFADVPHVSNFHSFTAGWNSNIYFTADNEVWEYDPVTGEIRHLRISELPDTQTDATSTTTYAGVTYSEDGLYAIHETNLSAIPGPSVVRIDFNKDGNAQFDRWVLQSLNGYRPRGPLQSSRLFSSLGTGRHLWMATTTAGKVLRMTIPRSNDPTLDATSEYSVVDNTYRSGWMHHNFPAQWKDYTEILLDLSGLNAVPPTCTVDVYYYLDGDLSTRYTMDTGLSSNKLYNLEFSNGVSARTFMLELILHSDASNQTPQVLSWNVKAAVKFDFREVMTLTVRVGDRIRARNNTTSPHTAVEIRNRLRTWRAQKNITLAYQDYRGYNFDNIRILTGFNEVDNIDDKYRTDETLLTLRILRVAPSSAASFVVGSDTVGSPAVVGA